MDLITTLLESPEMVLPKNTINCCFGLPNCCNHDTNVKCLNFLHKDKDYDLNKAELSS